MKTIITSFIISFFVGYSACPAQAQTAYEKGMNSAIETLFADQQSQASFLAAANKFERIAQVEKEKWQPVYYTALAYAWLATTQETLSAKDATMEQAKKWIKTGLERAPGNVEFVTLQGYADMLSLSFDPGTRGQSMSTSVFATFNRAVQMDPANPRARLFLGQMQHGTEQFFGQGHEASCETFNKALTNYETAPESSDFSPTWGRGMAEQMVSNCSSDTKAGN